MKKFLQFILELIIPLFNLFIYVIGALCFILLLTWIFTGLGIMIILCPEEFPTPEWIKWLVIIFDVIIILLLIIEHVTKAYKNIYK